MSTALQGNVRSARAAVDLSAHEYRAVKLTTNGELDKCTVAGETGYGVMVDYPLQGEYGTVQVYDAPRWVAGAAVNPGQAVTTDATGRCVPAAAGNYIWGHAVTKAGGAGEIITVEICRPVAKA